MLAIKAVELSETLVFQIKQKHLNEQLHQQSIYPLTMDKQHTLFSRSHAVALLSGGRGCTPAYS